RLAAVLFVLSAASAEAQTRPARDGLAANGDGRLTLRDRESLFGDWGGLRPWLRARGVEFEFVHTGEWFGNTGGGLEEGSDYRGDLSLMVELDTERAGWWRDGEFFLHLQAQYGEG